MNVSGTGSILQANGGMSSLGYLGGSGTLTVSNGGTVKFGSSGSDALSMGISNGSGTLNIGTGRLVANNTTGSATGTGSVLAQANTTLAGNGTISGAVTMLGTFAPGNSVGKLNTGSLTIGATGTYAWELNNATGTAGTTAGGWDLANVTGTLTFQPGASLDILSLDTNNLTGQAANFNPLANYLWTIATTTGGVTGLENVTLDTTGFQNTIQGTFALETSGNNLQLRYTAVPEPSAILAMLGGAAITLRRKRRLL